MKNSWMTALFLVSESAVEGKPPHHNSTDAQKDSKDFPEHLRPLIKGLAGYLSLCEWEELAGAIYEYRDVLSSDLFDMG